MDGALGIHAEETFFVEALGGTCSMHHIVPPLSAHLFLVGEQLLLQPLWIGEVEFGKVGARVGQVAFAACLAHAGPHVMAQSEAFLYDETANEATGSGH